MKIITTHKNADFDALSSVFAASLLYPGAMPVLPRTLNPNVRAFLSIHKDLFSFILPAEVDLEKVSELIVVDANRWSRLDGMDALKEKFGLTIHLWDHHLQEGDITADWSCVEKTGSATTLLVGLIEKEGKTFSTIQASLFLAGIYEDTGNLSFPTTTARDARAAAFLLERNADLSMLNSFLRPVYGPKQKDILFEMVKDTHRRKIKGHTVSLSKVKIKGHTPGLALVVDMYQDIINVDAAFGIFTEPKKNTTMIIGRSVTDALDIGVIMRSLGGGGHPGAGSAILKSVNPDAIEKWIEELIKGNQQSTVQISDLMSFPVITVSPETPMSEVDRLLREKGCSGFPVIDKTGVVGIVSRRDFRKVKNPRRMAAPVKAFMCTKVVQIPPGSSIVQAAKLMIRHDIGRLPVVNDGKLIGIITRSDTMRYYYDLLPDQSLDIKSSPGPT